MSDDEEYFVVEFAPQAVQPALALVTENVAPPPVTERLTTSDARASLPTGADSSQCRTHSRRPSRTPSFAMCNWWRLWKWWR